MLAFTVLLACKAGVISACGRSLELVRSPLGASEPQTFYIPRNLTSVDKARPVRDMSRVGGQLLGPSTFACKTSQGEQLDRHPVLEHRSCSLQSNITGECYESCLRPIATS